RPLDVGPRREAAERGVVVPPVPWVDDQPERRQHVDPVGKLPGRHDADDRVWLAIQRDAPTHDPRSAPKPRLQKPSLRITTAGPPGTDSSGRNGRPSAGAAPIVR